MPLTKQDQLAILQDILISHQLDCCGTASECQQVERLIQSLLDNQQVSEYIKATLLDVYNYSQYGQHTKNINQHIDEHKDELSKWISNLNEYNLTQ